jgi:hypothetical protein
MAVESVGVACSFSVTGVKVTRLTGAKEVERLVGTGTSESYKSTHPIVQTQRVSSKMLLKLQSLNVMLHQKTVNGGKIKVGITLMYCKGVSVQLKLP